MYKGLLILNIILLTCNARTYHSDIFSFDDSGLRNDKNAKKIDSITDGPPPHTEYAKVARYLVHRSDWTAMGTNSKYFPGFPMVNIISIADSPKREKSTGNIYFYLTDLDFTGQDLTQDNKLTLLLSQEQDLSCTNANTDAMEPTCARIMVSGSITKVCRMLALKYTIHLSSNIKNIFEYTYS